jgi:hypothetical protein
MRATRCLVALVLLAPPVAFAQTTPDGVDAFDRGDYQRAAQILTPIAERWPGADDERALFHLATMYQKGLGVPADPMRACILFSRVAFPLSPTPGRFVREAIEQLHRVQETMTSEQANECFFVAHFGFEQGSWPATFMLGPRDWIALDLSREKWRISATISRAGKDTRRDVGVMMLPGTRFLSIEHTVLMTGASRRTPRDFIEFFTWFPIPGGQWSLSWQLFEVVRDDLVSVTGARLVTISAERPPMDFSSELRELVRLQVNDSGNAAWDVRGPNPQSDVIETDAERREVSELSRLRREADARVDWTRKRDVQDVPSLMYTDSDGCRNLFVYAWSEDRTEAITVQADRNVLELSTTPRSFDLAAHPELEIEVHVSEQAEHHWPFCTDVIVLGTRRHTWRATTGRVTIELSAPGIRARLPLAYRATIRIAGAEFVSATGARVKQARQIVLSAVVGRFSD